MDRRSPRQWLMPPSPSNLRVARIAPTADSRLGNGQAVISCAQLWTKAGGTLMNRIFVGRQAEREQLAQLAARAQSDQPQAVLLDGEAGAGKTALLDYVLEAAERDASDRVADADG